MSYHGLDPRDWKDEPSHARMEDRDDAGPGRPEPRKTAGDYVWRIVIIVIVAWFLVSWINDLSEPSSPVDCVQYDRMGC